MAIVGTGTERPHAQATRQLPVLPMSGASASSRPSPPGWTPGGCSPAIFLVAFVVLLILAGAGLANQQRTRPGTSATATAPAPATAGATVGRVGTIVFVVGNTGGDGVYLRKSPRKADRDRAYADGTRLEQIGPDQTAEGMVWHNVRAPDGRTGWVPAQYTIPAP